MAVAQQWLGLTLPAEAKFIGIDERLYQEGI